MNLNVNYESLKSIGNSLISKSNEFDSLLSNINNINSEIAGVWAGTDSVKYSQSVESQAQVMRKLSSLIGDIGSFLIKVGNAYENASQENANSINFN